MSAYYNEIDPFAAEWLRELIKAGMIAPGEVDERSIEDVLPADIRGFSQHHFFAGIGVWSYALRQAGWSDDRPVWTGSCPCQPFSAAGKGAGFADERHLWPSFFRLIEQCHPSVVFGEQVASKAVEPWIDLVQADLEAVGYAFGCVPFPAASVGAPHIRDRAFWVADSSSERLEGSNQRTVGRQRQTTERSCCAVGLADSGNSSGQRSESRATVRGLPTQTGGDVPHRPAGPTNGFWRDADWLLCRDGKWRPVEPAFKQMVDGLACAMVYLRDAGNNKKIKEVIHETATNPSSNQVLRALRGSYSTESVWLSLGRQIGFFETTLLFAFMLEHEGKLGEFINCAASKGAEECQVLLRDLRIEDEFTGSSSGYELPEQFPGKLTDALRELSQESALATLSTLNGSPLANKAAQRVGRLRGYGNAINAEAAKAFIKAFMEITK